ncbi:MAG: murein transglycosylase A [Acidobacteria bacterium]|nr:murein transglycosylase A [Acidobacteriota bacterium]
MSQTGITPVEVEGRRLHRPRPRPPVLTLSPTTFDQLPGWGEDDVSKALPPLLDSCGRLRGLSPDQPFGPDGVDGTVGDWQRLCRQAAKVPKEDAEAVRLFFEGWTRPWLAADHERSEGLFTGYYEPTLQGSRRRHGRYDVPLYRRPPELVSLDLGKFRQTLRGQRLAGKVISGELVPFADRAGIDAGSLAGRGLELAWVDDPIAAFFLHIQGSGRIELAEGGSLRVGYAGQNGHAYVAIGRELVERGALGLDEVSLQTIREWLHGHPDVAPEILRANPSYVFFRELSERGPVGAQGLVLEPGRSLAVDRSFHALGVPMWLDTTLPGTDPGSPGTPFRRLLVAQDTGGAIRGPVRGDVFWGPGEVAEEIAGRMRQAGRLWLLLPSEVTPPSTLPGGPAH